MSTFPASTVASTFRAKSLTGKTLVKAAFSFTADRSTQPVALRASASRSTMVRSTRTSPYAFMTSRTVVASGFRPTTSHATCSSGTESFDNWADFASSYPTYKIADAIPFIIADQALVATPSRASISTSPERFQQSRSKTWGSLRRPSVRRDKDAPERPASCGLLSFRRCTRCTPCRSGALPVESGWHRVGRWGKARRSVFSREQR